MSTNPIPGGPYHLEELEAALPFIPWREPQTMSLIEAPDEKYYACRVCIANRGIKGADVPNLPKDPNLVRKHIETEHSLCL